MSPARCEIRAKESSRRTWNAERCVRSVLGVELLCDFDHGGALVEVDGHDRSGSVTLAGAWQDAGAQERRSTDLWLIVGLGGGGVGSSG